MHWKLEQHGNRLLKFRYAFITQSVCQIVACRSEIFQCFVYCYSVRGIFNKTLQLFLLIFGIHSSLYSLDIEQLRFEVIDIKDGLSHNSVQKIYQDSKGFVWFCTDEGLNRYDGYNFVKFSKDLDNKNSLVSNFTSCIAESSPGIFWIGTEKGLSVYIFETKKFINLENPSQIRKLTVEDSLTVWVHTMYSLYKMRLAEKDRKNLDYTLVVEPMNAYRDIICKSDSNHFLLAGRDNKFYSYHSGTKLIKARNDIDLFSYVTSKKIIDVVKDKFGNYWIGTGKGLFRINAGFASIDSFQTEKRLISGLQDKITGLAVGKLGNIYIATLQQGLLIYDINRNGFVQHQSDPYNLNSIPDNKLLSILIDKSGTLWVGTKGSGVAVHSHYKYKFKHITQEPFKTTWLTNKYVLCFESDNKDNIWIGTDGGGLYKYDTRSNIFSNWRNNRFSNSLSNDIVQHLLIDKNGTLWAGTLNGICRFDPSTNSFRRYFLNAHKPSDNLKSPAYENIRLFETRSGSLYAMDEHSIFFFNPGKNVFENTALNFNSSNIRPRGVYEDDDGTWWMATSNGLFHLSLNTGLLDEKKLQQLNKNYFKTDQLNCLLPENERYLWIGSSNSGVFLFDKKQKSIAANYSVKEGLNNNFIHGMLKDNAGRLWLSTNRGVSVFESSVKQFRNYDINDGLQSNEFNTGSFHKTKNNDLLFGGMNGFNIIEPDKIPFNGFKPTPNLINIRIDDKSYDFFTYRNQEKRINFGNSENNISFEFSSGDYANIPKNLFEYKLDGYEKNWVKTSRNYVSYSKLPPGNYVFYVRSSNNDGIWSSNAASFSFRIKPMFWQTWWFRIIAAIAIIVYGTYFIRSRIQRARDKEKEKMQLARQKTEFEKQLAEIKLKALVSQMNPHFIFNCMNSIQAMILSDQNMQASTYLTKLSRLVRSVLENSVKTFIPLNDVIENLKLYLELESIRFDQQFNFTITTEGVDIYSIELPSMLIQPYVENSIWHGLLKKEGEKNIYIRFYQKGKYLVCEVEDNGIGRNKANELNLRKQHKSLGTMITREMFETLHKIKDTSYQVNTLDLYDEQHQPGGTKVIIEMELN
jgi:ligand-binding sensor domain-containing protein